MSAGNYDAAEGAEQIMNEPATSLDHMGEFMENIFNNRMLEPDSFTPRDFLNFGIDGNMDFNNDYLFLASPELSQPHPPTPSNETGKHSRSASTQAGVDAFKNSLWCWAPSGEAFRGVDSLQTPASVGNDQDSTENSFFPLALEVDQATRDRIMIMLSDGFHRCVANTPSLAKFPSAKVLTELLRLAFIYDSNGLDSWIRLDMTSAELPTTLRTVALIATGACQSHLPSVQKFGIAILEALRITMYGAYDADNSLSRNLIMLQSQALSLRTGLWSGQSRNIEIAESFVQIPITMLRRAGKFRGTKSSGESSSNHIHERWTEWRKAEAYRRLVLEFYAIDAQMSMSLLINPLISGVEMQSPLPSSPTLWTAGTAEEWITAGGGSMEMPSLADCINDILNFTEVRHSVDWIPSALAILYGYWNLIAQYRQSVALSNGNTVGQSPLTNSLMLTSRKQELMDVLRRFRTHVIDQAEGVPNQQICLTVELLTMYLHVSMEELQNLAGKEGMDESRKVYPRLQQWVQNQESKVSVWSAGQVLRFAKGIRPGMLRDFIAIAVYHASLTLFCYGVIQRAGKDFEQSGSPVLGECFALDGSGSNRSERFLSFGQGSPYVSANAIEGHFDATAGDALLTDPQAIMRVCLQILERNFEVQGETRAVKQPPLVANLSQLMRDLMGGADFVFR